MATKTDSRIGNVKGEPIRFIAGHHGKRSELLPWLKAAITAHGDSDKCLEWPFSTNTGGYGQIGVLRLREGPIPVHRVAFYLTYGRWPTPCGLHKCDNRLCFNPSHIFEGTVADNNADTRRKGRSGLSNGGGPGEENPNSKLTLSQVESIRREYIPFRNGIRRLAKKYGVGSHAIHAIITGETWKIAS